MAVQDGTTLNQAVQRLLSTEQEQPTGDEAETTEEAAPEATEEFDYEPTGDTEVEGADAEDSSDEQPEAEERHTVRVGDEEHEVTLEDLRKGYMMQSDYSRKTAALSQQRKELEAKAADIEQRLSDAEDIVKLEEDDLTSRDALELKELDPTAYYERREKVEQRKAKLEQLRKASEEDRNAAVQAQLAEQRQMTLERIPEWLDQDVMQRETKAIQDLWVNTKVPERIMMNPLFQDASIIELSRKAALYDMSQATTSQPTRKRAPKSAAPAASQTNATTASKASQERRARLRKSGAPRDAQKVILDMMKR